MTYSNLLAILRNGLLALLFGTLAACGDIANTQSSVTTDTVKVSASLADTPSSTTASGSATDTSNADISQGDTVVIPDVSLTLSWQPNTGDDMGGYIVYYGPDMNTVNMEVATITTTTAGFDPLAPSIQFNSWSDLGAQPDDYVCFQVRAYNNVGASEPSSAVCGTIPTA
jgi:hypothetical protein